MCDIIQKWLRAKLGVIINLKSVSFGEITKDGSIIAELLHIYGVINTVTLNSIKKTNDANIALKNLNILNEAFKKIGINCKGRDLYLISQGQDSPALKLLYKLYLKLYNKNEVYFILNDSLQKKKDDTKEETSSKNNYFNLYQTSIDDLKWYKEKYVKIISANKQKRRSCHKLENVGLDKVRQMMNKSAEKNEMQVSYFQNALTRNKIIISERDDASELSCKTDITKAKKYVLYLKKKHKKISENYKTSMYMHKVLLDDVMTSISKKEENEIKSIFTSKLIKQMEKEKQMTTKKLEVQAQRAIMIQNKHLENRLFMEKCLQEVTNHGSQQEHNVHMNVMNYKMEEERRVELHTRLYREKLEREHQENCKVCSKIYDDLVDLALRVGEYRSEYKSDVPRRTWMEWRNLFKLGQPIFNVIENVEDILKEEVDESDALTAELYRQDGLDEQDLLAYFNYYPPWDIDKSLYETSISAIDAGLNVIGFVIHRLLLTKYPVPKYPGIPELPSVTVAAAVNGITNDLFLSILTEVLARKNVALLDMNDAINFCLESYKIETKVDVDYNLEKTGNNMVKSKEKKHKKEKKSKGKMIISEKSEGEIKEKPEMFTKETQTPKIFPNEEVKLSRQAELGKLAYETLNLGLTINNFLLVQIFVAYLMSLKIKTGWVLTNYPENIYDAIIFELILNGKYELNKEYLEEDITYIIDLTPVERDELLKPVEDKYAKERLSNLLPNTLPARENPDNKSYLTSYVYLIENRKKSAMENAISYVDSLELVQEFYKKLGCNTCLYYDDLDAVTIRNATAAIMKDEVFANEMYETVIQVSLKMAQEKQDKERQAEAQHLNKETKKGAKKKSTKTKSTKNLKDKASEKSLPAKDASTVKVELIPETEPEVQKYVTLDIPEDYQKTLATVWENIEEIYINDLKQIFFVRRVHLNLIPPYCQKITDYMNKLIEKPDDKQIYLHKFQTFYNSIETDLLQDEEIKTELHFRIQQFQSILWNMSFHHMRECDGERIQLIRGGWFCNLASEIVTTVISGMQLEMERCIRTLQLLEDYYVMMVAHEVPFAKFYNSMLPSFEYTNEEPGIRRIETAFMNGKEDLTNNIFNDAIKKTLSLALSTIVTTYTTTHKNIKRFESMPEHNPKAKKGKKGKEPLPPKEGNKTLALVANEWQIATDGEFERAKMRLNVIYSRAVDDIKELLLDGQNLFQDIHEKMRLRYQEEINSVNKACIFLRRALEANQSIAPQLVLKGNEFDINKDVLLMEPVPRIIECLYERDIPSDFSFDQLQRLYVIFSDLGPTGYLSKIAFIYLLEDMVANTEENPILPPHWKDLTSPQVSKLVREIYGNTDFINWKDFLIFIMEIPFPTEVEILETYDQFQRLDIDKEEFVNKEEYDNIQFWFENDPDVSEEKMEFFKTALRHIFTVDGCISYPDLFLSFCKDTHAILGFTKALELCLGKLVCWNVSAGTRYLAFWRYRKELDKEGFYKTLVCDENLHNNSTQANENVSSRNSIMEAESCLVLSDEQSNVEELEGEEEETSVDQFLECAHMCYFLSFETILNVLLTALPWHYKFDFVENKSLYQYLGELYESLRNEEFDNNVVAHEFLNDKSFKKVLETSNKFVIKSPNDIVVQMIEKCKCEEEEIEEEEIGEEVEDEMEEEEWESEVEGEIVDICDYDSDEYIDEAEDYSADELSTEGSKTSSNFVKFVDETSYYSDIINDKE